jgi:ribosomal protein S6--L-glutamate ligase
LHRLKARGIPVLNPPLALETCIDKYLCSARLEAAGLHVPPTVVCQDAETAQEAFAALGRDVVVKPIFGSEGRGLVRISDEELAWRTFRTLERTQAVIYVQQFVPHPGWDLRVFVLGDAVLAGMKRHAKKDWRTNVAQGGVGEPVHVDKSEADIALRAARCTGLVAGGVDLLPGPDGTWYVLEVNAVPGWRALARVCGLDVATEIIKTVVKW